MNMTTSRACIVAALTTAALGAAEEPVPAPANPAPVAAAPASPAPETREFRADPAAGDGDLDQLGRIALFVGAKVLDDDEWDPIDTHAEVGVLWTYGVEDFPVDFQANGFVSGMSNDGVDGMTVELQLGVSHVFLPGGPVEIMLGAGPALAASAYRPDGGDTDTDIGLGFWAAVGAYVRLPQRFFIGPVIDYSNAKVELGNDDIDAGGFHAGLVAGYGW